MQQLMYNIIIVVCAQGSACQCNVFHIIIANWGTQFIDREGILRQGRGK